MYLPFIVVLLSLASPMMALEKGHLRRQIAVKGYAKLQKPSDEASITLGVLTEAKSAEEALTSNAEKMQNLIQALEGAGLSTQEYATGRFSLRPLYTQRPPKADDNWEPTIRGYGVENSLILHTQKISKIASWLDIAVQNGANIGGEILFSLHDSQSYRKEAIEVAVANAKTEASILAKSAGVELGKVLNLTLDAAVATPMPKFMAVMARSYESAPQTPIISGNVDVQAEVTALFEIAN